MEFGSRTAQVMRPAGGGRGGTAGREGPCGCGGLGGWAAAAGAEAWWPRGDAGGAGWGLGPFYSATSDGLPKSVSSRLTLLGGGNEPP